MKCTVPRYPRVRVLPKTWMVMKFVIALMLAASLHVSAEGYAQTITLKARNAPLENIFQQIEQQTGYFFVYRDEWMKEAKKITIEVKNASLRQVLDRCFKDQPLTYSIVERTIVIKQKEIIQKQAAIIPPVIDVKGRVINESGEPVAGATVAVKGPSGKITASTDLGEFVLNNIDGQAVLLVTSIGYELQEMPVNNRALLIIRLKKAPHSLDETVIIAYGTTSKRFNTGSVSKITSGKIEKQPVANPLAALQGRAPGVLVTQSNGLPGSNITVQIRGQNSILNGNDPLYIIDGVPFNSQPLDMVNVGYPSQQSPFNSISPGDIESIEVLKDADATAIYGSRGANGVVLITTKKGKPGKTRFEANFYTGFGKVTRTMDYMNTRQYLEMRKEALQNDGLPPIPALAPDLLLWDTTRYTDWQDMMIGGTSRTTDASASVSGGNTQTQFLLSANYHYESTVFPGNLSGKRSNLHFNLNHKTADKKLSVALTASYSNDNNNLIGAALFSFLNLSPNAPLPYDDHGKLNWSEGGVYYNNPMAYLLQNYNAVTDNLVSNAVLRYEVLPGLTLKTSVGYTFTHLDQVSARPKASQNPQNNPVSSASFGNNTVKSWIIEPQAEYVMHIGNRGRLVALIGSTWQQQVNNGNVIRATNYSNDGLLGSTAGAASITTDTRYSQYRYQAVFGRLNYNWMGKYLINLTGRRDGSSRFGPGNQYANFGAAGIGWIFSQERWVGKSLPFLSFGKLRASYGASGNDQIGNYNYLPRWRSTDYPYQGIAGLQPASLYNPEYAWEVNRKLEAALELGLLQDRIFISANYFRNRSSNQLVNYTLPAQTGFTGIMQNLNALVENTGWEFELHSTNIKLPGFSWNTSLNLTLARNKLLEFPGLEKSSYANDYVIGEPLNIEKVFRYNGIDPTTGIYTFEGTNIPADLVALKDLTPEFYGGFSNTFQWKGFEVDLLFQFVKQQGFNYYFYNPGYAPGTRYNQPVQFLDRWQKPGDEKFSQVYTAGLNVNAFLANYNLGFSEAAISDASYIRLKNLSVSYSLSPEILQKIKAQNLRLFIQGQNLLTITDYFGADPENQSSSLPPLKVITAGFRVSF